MRFKVVQQRQISRRLRKHGTRQNQKWFCLVLYYSRLLLIIANLCLNL